jgi:hypothetical protein
MNAFRRRYVDVTQRRLQRPPRSQPPADMHPESTVGHLIATTPFSWALHEQPRTSLRYSPIPLRHVRAEAGFEVVELHRARLSGPRSPCTSRGRSSATGRRPRPPSTASRSRLRGWHGGGAFRLWDAELEPQHGLSPGAAAVGEGSSARRPASAAGDGSRTTATDRGRTARRIARAIRRRPERPRPSRPARSPLPGGRSRQRTPGGSHSPRRALRPVGGGRIPRQSCAGTADSLPSAGSRPPSAGVEDPALLTWLRPGLPRRTTSAHSSSRRPSGGVLGSLVEVNAQQRRIAPATTAELAGTEVAPLEKRG